MKDTNDLYPQSKHLQPNEALSYLPDSLLHFLETIITSKNKETKISSIGQALTQAARPRSLTAPLLFGLGIELYRMYESRFLIQTLNEMGFCCSYTDVTQFEKNAAYQQGTDLVGYDSNKFVQYIADNVDHNVCTVDGNGTFHGMGIMATITPSSSVKHFVLKKEIKMEDLSDIGRIQIYTLTF